MVLNEITYYPFLGKPLILWGGILTLLTLMGAGALPFLNQKKIISTPPSWHPWASRIGLLLGLVHGALGILAYF